MSYFRQYQRTECFRELKELKLKPENFLNHPNFECFSKLKKINFCLKFGKLNNSE